MRAMENKTQSSPALATGTRFRRLLLSPEPAVLVLVVLHFGLLMVFFEPALCTPDAHGYFAQARLLAETGSSLAKAESPAQY